MVMEAKVVDIRVANNIKITDLQTYNITPMQLNLMIALFTRGGTLNVGDLISCVRASNSGYKFIPAENFYRAITTLHTKTLVVVS